VDVAFMGKVFKTTPDTPSGKTLIGHVADQLCRLALEEGLGSWIKAP